MNYQDAVKLITTPKKFQILLELTRIKNVLKLLDNPQDKINCIHIAGTNGKGSVCAILASILKSAGKKTGLFTSPHIFKYTERIQINGNPIDDNEFAKYVSEISALADKNNINLTEFEILTAVMFKYFYDKKVDVAVIETGLGGRFDATNVIKKPLCSIITHIDYDHTERLGNTLDKIAFEKAGIIKPNSTCIVLEGREVYYDKASEVGAELEIVTPVENIDMLSLNGINQKENLSLALAAIEKCFPEINQEQIELGLRNVKHPCRFQYIKDKNLIIDGAHNPNGIDSLVQNLDYYYPNKKRRFIFGCLRNKDYRKMLSHLVTDKDEIYFYNFSHSNSATFEELQSVCPIKAQKLERAEQINFNDGRLNIICGSFYMIAELVEFLKIVIP